MLSGFSFCYWQQTFFFFFPLFFAHSELMGGDIISELTLLEDSITKDQSKHKNICKKKKVADIWRSKTSLVLLAKRDDFWNVMFILKASRDINNNYGVLGDHAKGLSSAAFFYSKKVHFLWSDGGGKRCMVISSNVFPTQIKTFLFAHHKNKQHFSYICFFVLKTAVWCGLWLWRMEKWGCFSNFSFDQSITINFPFFEKYLLTFLLIDVLAWILVNDG